MSLTIRQIETFMVPPGWTFVRVLTDDGVDGWGEAGADIIAPAVVGAISQMAELLVGRPAHTIEDHWQLMMKGGFYRGGPILCSAVAAIDEALWDIAGKVHGVPVYDLLGGPVRDRMRVYGWAGDGMDSPAEVSEIAASLVAKGFDAMKTCLSVQRGALTARDIDVIVECAEAVRETIGPDRDFGIDFHGRCQRPVVRALLAALEPTRPFFAEEALLPEYSADFGQLAMATTIPIATGERLHSRWDVKQVIGSGISILQPDVSQAGGISETRRICALAEAYDVRIAPHHAIGPIALAASLQLCFTTPNMLIQERDVDWWGGLFERYVENPEIFSISAGHVARPERPGLGIVVNEQEVRKNAQPEPVRRFERNQQRDGSFAEW
jgi:galactonate dehydratase